MKVKIVSWNCHYGFEKNKPQAIKKYDANILVIPECREMDMEVPGYDENHRKWYGDHKEAKDHGGNANKEKDLGIGVFWKEGITISRLAEWDKTWKDESNFRYLVPYKVEGNFKSFTLIAVWTKNKTDASDPLDYIQKAHAAIDEYKKAGLLDGRVVLIGDFNSNAIWDDRYKKDWNHSALVDKLKNSGIVDCSTINGKRQQDTYVYYTKNGEKLVTDDYCFASADIAKTAKFSVPGPDEWTLENGVKRWNSSDHCPISVEFEI